MQQSPRLAYTISNTARATFFDEINPRREHIPHRSSPRAGAMPAPAASPISYHAAASNSLRKELRSAQKETVLSQGQASAESGAAASSHSEPFRPTISLLPASDASYDARQNILLMDFIPANTARSKIKQFFANQQHGRGSNPSKIEIMAFPISGRSRTARVEFSTRDDMMQALSDGQEKNPSIFVFVSQDTIEEVRLQLRGLENDVHKQLAHMSILKERGDWRSCLAVFGVLDATVTAAHFHIAVQACENCQKGDVADALLHLMAERGVKIEQRTIHACIRACCSSGIWEKATKHLESILNSAECAIIEPDLFDLLSACLGRAGQWERALEMTSLKNANDARALRSSLVDEWRAFKQQNEEVFSFCRTALTIRSGFPLAFRDLLSTQQALASELREYCRDFEELAAFPIACQISSDFGSIDEHDESTSFE